MSQEFQNTKAFQGNPLQKHIFMTMELIPHNGNLHNNEAKQMKSTKYGH